jgi:hypothetical protein
MTIKSRRMRWARYVVCINILVGKPEEKRHSEDLGVDETILLKEYKAHSVRGCRLDISGSG